MNNVDDLRRKNADAFELIRQDYRNLALLKHQSKKLVRFALRQNVAALHFVKDQATYAKYACNIDPNAINLITDVRVLCRATKYNNALLGSLKAGPLLDSLLELKPILITSMNSATFENYRYAVTRGVSFRHVPMSHRKQLYSIALDRNVSESQHVALEDYDYLLPYISYGMYDYLSPDMKSKLPQRPSCPKSVASVCDYIYLDTDDRQWSLQSSNMLLMSS